MIYLYSLLIVFFIACGGNQDDIVTQSIFDQDDTEDSTEENTDQIADKDPPIKNPTTEDPPTQNQSINFDFTQGLCLNELGEEDFYPYFFGECGDQREQVIESKLDSGSFYGMDLRGADLKQVEVVDHLLDQEVLFDDHTKFYIDNLPQKMIRAELRAKLKAINLLPEVNSEINLFKMRRHQLRMIHLYEGLDEKNVKLYGEPNWYDSYIIDINSYLQDIAIDYAFSFWPMKNIDDRELLKIELISINETISFMSLKIRDQILFLSDETNTSEGRCRLRKKKLTPFLIQKSGDFLEVYCNKLLIFEKDLGGQIISSVTILADEGEAGVSHIMVFDKIMSQDIIDEIFSNRPLDIFTTRLAPYLIEWK